ILIPKAQISYGNIVLVVAEVTCPGHVNRFAIDSQRLYVWFWTGGKMIIAQRTDNDASACAYKEATVPINRNGIEVRFFVPNANLLTPIPHTLCVDIVDVNTKIVYGDYISIAVCGQGLYGIVPQSHPGNVHKSIVVKPINSVVLRTCPYAAIA